MGFTRQEYWRGVPLPSPTLYELTQITGPNLGEQKPKGRKNLILKPGKRRPQINNNNNTEKAEKHYTNERTN